MGEDQVIVTRKIALAVLGVVNNVAVTVPTVGTLVLPLPLPPVVVIAILISPNR
jgi:hypothetical protein